MNELSAIDSFNGLTINLEILSVCNFSCPYCYERKKMQQCKFFKKSEILQISNALGQSRHPIRLCLVGGEPLLHPHLQFIVDVFSENGAVKELIIFSNASRPEKIPNGKIRWILSYHPSQDNSNFMNSVRLIQGTQNEVEVRFLIDKKREYLSKTEVALTELGVKCLPTYLYKPSAEYDPETRRARLPDRFLQCENTAEFLLNGNPVSRRSVLEKHPAFIGGLCTQSRICINYLGNVCIGCGPAVTNLFREPDFFSKYDICQIRCECKTCAKDMFLEQTKKF